MFASKANTLTLIPDFKKANIYARFKSYSLPAQFVSDYTVCIERHLRSLELGKVEHLKIVNCE